jgi:hypothetical protein
MYCSKLSGQRDVVIKTRTCLTRDYYESIDKADLALHEIPATVSFTKPFLVAFDTYLISKPIISSLEPLGLWTLDKKQFKKSQTWVLTCQIQNPSQFLLEIDKIAIATDLKWVPIECLFLVE